MSNRCPKCNEKLSPLYMKQTCPKCGTNLVYYDLDKRLQEDHEKAMREQEAVDNFLYKLKMSTVGGAIQLVRFITFFSPLIWMCLPMFKTADGTEITLIGVIMGIINGSMSFDKILGDKSYLFPIITMVCVIIFSLAVIISTCFSMGKKSLLRNQIFSALNFIVFIACIIISIKSGAAVLFGAIIVAVVYMLEAFMHHLVNKKINK